MQIKIFDDKGVLCRTAAEHAARPLRACIAGEGVARIVAATAASQFEFLEAFTSATEIAAASVAAICLVFFAAGGNKEHGSRAVSRIPM